MRTRGGFAATLLQCVIQVRFRNLPSRRHSKQQAAKQREQQREAQHPEIESQMIPTRGKLCRFTRIREANEVNAPVSDQDAKRPTGKSDQHTLSKQLANNPPTA